MVIQDVTDLKYFSSLQKNTLLSKMHISVFHFLSLSPKSPCKFRLNSFQILQVWTKFEFLLGLK